MIVPVYGLAGLVDFLVLNVIEFWQGKSPAMGESDAVIRTAQVGADRFVQTLRHRDEATEMSVERFRDGALVDRLTLRQPDGSDRLTGSLEAPGAPAVTLLAERDGESLLLTRTVAGQAPERLSSPAEVSSLEARVLAALGPAAPTAVARASHVLVSRTPRPGGVPHGAARAFCPGIPDPAQSDAPGARPRGPRPP